VTATKKWAPNPDDMREPPPAWTPNPEDMRMPVSAYTRKPRSKPFKFDTEKGRGSLGKGAVSGFEPSVLERMNSEPQPGQVTEEKLAEWAPMIGGVLGNVPGALAGTAYRQSVLGTSNALSGGLLKDVIPGAEVPGSFANRSLDFGEQALLGSSKAVGMVAAPLRGTAKKLAEFSMMLSPESATIAIRHGITANKIGLKRLGNLIGMESNKVANSLLSSPIQTTVQLDRNVVGSILAPVVQKYSWQGIPGPDVGTITRMARSLLAKGPMDLFKLFKFKQAEADLAKKAWAMNAKGARITDAELDVHRALATWADETLKRILPPTQKAAYEAYNVTEQGLIKLKDAIAPFVNPAKGSSPAAQLLRQQSGYTGGAIVGPMLTNALRGAAIGGLSGGNWQQRTMFGGAGALTGGLLGNPRIGSNVAVRLADPRTAAFIARIIQGMGVAGSIPPEKPTSPQGGPPVAP
jgi:hypothetical protein